MIFTLSGGHLSYLFCVYVLCFVHHVLCTRRAVGNMMYGTQYHDQISETVRKAAEYCDSLQSFFILHSMGGGKESVLCCYHLFA